jgi:hypothetical protein
MNFTNGYQTGRIVGEHYLDYLIGFQIGLWMGVPLAIIKQMYSQARQASQSGHGTSERLLRNQCRPADGAQRN